MWKAPRRCTSRTASKSSYDMSLSAARRVEFAAVIAGAIVFCGWVRLIRTDVSDEVRVRSLWLGVFPLLVLYAIHLQVDFLTRRMGAREGLTETVR